MSLIRLILRLLESFFTYIRQLFSNSEIEIYLDKNLFEGVIRKPKLVKQLKNDMRDDWFPDPYFYNDILEDNLFINYLNTNLEENKGLYLVREGAVYNIPKPGHTLRYATELGFPDRCIYHALTAYLIPFYDKLLPWNVFSHRYDYKRARSSEKYLFLNPIEGWNHFTNSIKASLSEEKYLLSTDLSNYFEYIDLETLKETLIELIPETHAKSDDIPLIRSSIDRLIEFLKFWSPHKNRGIPQNRDASSFLANIYMMKLDIHMNEKFEPFYFRYMDDIKIICENEFDARYALKNLSVALRKLGLSVNTKKTKIIPIADKKLLSEHLDSENEDIQRMEVFWRKKTRESILDFLKLAKQRCLELIKDELVESREFRYCINRLIIISNASDLYIPEHFFSEIKAAIIDAIINLPASTDQYTNFLKSVNTTEVELSLLSEYLMDKSKSIYTWQNYRLWLLLAYKRFEHDDLLQHALLMMDAADSADRAGAMIYIGAVGGEPEKIKVAEKFSTLHTFLGQRCGLIACHELTYHEHVKTYIAPNLRGDLLGVYKSLSREDRKGKYVIENQMEQLLNLSYEGVGYD